jgi:hypothetical protein
MKTRRSLTLALALSVALIGRHLSFPRILCGAIDPKAKVPSRSAAVRLVTVSGATIPKGTVVIRGGLIVAGREPTFRCRLMPAPSMPRA